MAHDGKGHGTEVFPFNNGLCEIYKRVQCPVHQTLHIKITSIMQWKSLVIEYEFTILLMMP